MGLSGMEENKKSASPKKNCAYGGWRGCQGWCVPTWGATTDPPRLTAPAVAVFRLRLSLAWSCSQYAISDGRFTPPRGNLINSINS